MAEAGTSALVALVPGVDPLLRQVASLYPYAVRADLPAHATVLYPFLPASELVNAASDLKQIAAEHAPVELRLECEIEGDGFVGIAAKELDPLVSAMRARWPEFVPYDGQFGANPPVHVTIGMGLSIVDQRAVAELVDEYLPICETADTVYGAAWTQGGWSVPVVAPLSGSPAGTLW
jgi:hypothetical protein